MQKLTEIALEKIPQGVFTDANLQNLLRGSDDRRYGLVKRALAAGEVVRIRRGLYSLAPKYLRQPLDLYSLAQKIYGPSYISLESALSYHGWIPEAVYLVASVCAKRSAQFNTPLGNFSFQRIACPLF